MIAVVANGNIDQLDWLKSNLEKADIIIAADGGAKHILSCQLLPHYLVGDLDSLSKAEISHMRDNQVAIFQYPAEKDETDLELVFLKLFDIPDLVLQDHAVELFGAFGGRIDQTLANMLLLTHGKIKELQVVAKEPYQQVMIIDRSLTVRGKSGDKLSLIPLTSAVKIIRATNLKWPLVNEVLQFGPARGISNVMTADFSVIEIETGTGFLLCVHTDQSWQR